MQINKYSQSEWVEELTIIGQSIHIFHAYSAHKPVIDIYKRFKSCIAHINQSFDGVSEGKDLLGESHVVESC